MSASAVATGRRHSDETVDGLTLSEKMSLVYVASVPFDGTVFGGRSIPFMVGVVYLGVTILGRIRHGIHGEKRDLPIGNILPMFIFTIYYTATYFWSIAPDLTIVRVSALLVLVPISWFLSQDLARVGSAFPTALILGCLPVALLVLMATPDRLANRRTADGQVNDVALILLLGVACSLWMLLSGRGKARFFGFVTMPILIAGIVATGSRTAVLGGLAMLPTVAVWFAWKRMWQRATILLAMVALTAWIFSVLPAAMIPDRLTSIQAELDGGNLSYRTYIWDAIVHHGFSLTGIGAGATPKFIGQAFGIPFVAHNVLLGILLETGILGMLLFLVVLVKASIDARRSPYQELLIFMVPVLAISSMALSLEARRSFWLVITLAWVTRPKRQH